MSSTVLFAHGTRRLEEMIADARRMAYAEQYSFTEGWDDNTVAEIFNLGLNQLYHRITQIDNPANIQELVLDVFAGQQEYQIPIDTFMAIRIMDVRFLYGPPTETWAFITLRQGMIQDRFSYPTNIPDTYCIRDGKMLLSPTPNVTRPASLIINFQQRMRKLDIRRGKVAGVLSPQGLIIGATQANPCEITTDGPHGRMTGQLVSLTGMDGMFQLNERYYTITVTGSDTFTLDGIDSSEFAPYISGGHWFLNPIQFQLNFTVLSQKDVNMQANADSILDRIDWCCIVDVHGRPIVNAIPVSSYNQNTFILTALPTYVFPEDELNLLNDALANPNPIYVVQGDYSSTHSKLDRQCEDLLIEFAILRLYRLQSNAEPTKDQYDAEERVMAALEFAYRRIRPSIVPVVWQERLRPRSWPWGRRGLY